MNRSFILLLSLTTLLSACAPAAYYKPYGEGSTLTGEKGMGYRETEIEKGKWFVQFLATPSQSETDMLKFAVKRANEVGKNQCHGSYGKSEPTISSDTVAYLGGSFAGSAISTKSINITVICR